jgi:hypothetical protein
MKNTSIRIDDFASACVLLPLGAFPWIGLLLLVT